MAWRKELAAARVAWIPLTLYQKFEHAVVLILTALIMVVVIAALWNLAVKIPVSMVLTRTWDPTDYSVFQAVFGMIFTVIIALEFKRSLLVIAERKEGVVQVRTGRRLLAHPRPGPARARCARDAQCRNA